MRKEKHRACRLSIRLSQAARWSTNPGQFQATRKIVEEFARHRLEISPCLHPPCGSWAGAGTQEAKLVASLWQACG